MGCMGLWPRVRMPHHHAKTLERLEGLLEFTQRIVTSLYKGGSEEQVFRWVATQGELRRQQQTHPLGMGLLGGAEDFLGVAAHVAHHKIELRNSEF